MAVTSPIREAVAHSADAADLNAPAPALLLELQTLLGTITASVTEQTDRGRRPFRPGPDWSERLGSLAYGVYLLADQTGVDVDAAILATARRLDRDSQAPEPADSASWPFGGG